MLSLTKVLVVVSLPRRFTQFEMVLVLLIPFRTSIVAVSSLKPTLYNHLLVFGSTYTLLWPNSLNFAPNGKRIVFSECPSKTE